MRERKTKREYYIDVARIISSRSTCLRRRYGAVIVKDDEIVATGYNGAPRGEPNCCEIYAECPRKDEPHNSGNYFSCNSVHAEMNAIISASRHEMQGATMYLAGYDVDDLGILIRLQDVEPCPICQRLIKNAGITEVIT